MVINIKNKENITFKEIKVGTVFQLFHLNMHNDYYMKIGNLDSNETGIGTGAICLSNGILYNVKNDWVVVPVKDCSLTVEV